MELLLMLIYAAICVAVFKIFRIPVNKWTLPTAVLGGIFMIGIILLVMNYNHPFSIKRAHLFRHHADHAQRQGARYRRAGRSERSAQGR